MYGAILGDMIGSPYEADRGKKTKDFPLFISKSRFTDDTVLSLAVAEALMDSPGKSDDEIRSAVVHSMQKWGNRYPNAGYGETFIRWIKSVDPQPYGSYGNGSAMRVSSAGWLYDTIEETRRAARLTAEVTHDHPEGIKGAEAAASVIFLARAGYSKEEIKEYIEREFGYDLSRTCDEIRPDYFHDPICQKTLPEAFASFMDGTDFEDVVRNAVSLGGDTDTLGCIAGAFAEAFYGVPEHLKAECRKRLPPDLSDVLRRFIFLRERLGRIPPARKDSNGPRQTLRVTGRGRLRVKPDSTRVTMTLKGVSREYAQTLSSSSRDTETLRSILTGFGFAPSDLKTLSFGVDPEYESRRDVDGNDRQVHVGFRYCHTMKVEFPSDNDLLGRVLYALSHGSVDPELRLSYFASDPESAKNRLLAGALADARAKARALTQASGMLLGEIQSMDCVWGEFDLESRPMPGAILCDGADSSLRAMRLDLNIEPDDIELSDAVTVVWEIR